MSEKLTIIKAGAGAGKTTYLIKTLITQVLEYYKQNNKFPRVAVSTFTRKATRELKERMIVKALKSQNQDLIQYINYSPYFQVSTLHGLFNYFIQTHGYKVGLSPGVSVMNEQESDELFISILKSAVFEKNISTPLLDHYSFEEITAIVKRYIRHRQAHPKSRFIEKKELETILTDKEKEITQTQDKKSKAYDNQLLELKTEKAYIATFIHLFQELKTLGEYIIPLWEGRKKALSQITLNDIETMTLQILKKQKNQLNFMDFWFLDEYQDTSFGQKNILDQLCQNSQVFIVGDPQQSIYHFRGADVSVFQKKELLAKNKPTTQIKYLKTNYRSSPELIAFLNDFFPEKTYERMEPENKIYKKQKEVARFIFIHSDPKQTEEEREFKETENRIKELLKQGAKPEDIVVLSRQNKALQQLAQYLKRPKPKSTDQKASSSSETIPVCLHSAGSFKNRREIIDAIFLLRFLLNPHDEENLIGLLRTPYLRIPDQTLAERIGIKKLSKKNQKSTSLWNFLSHPKPLSMVIQKLKHYIEQTHKIGIVDSFQQALETLGFMDLSYYQDATGVREANLWKFIYCLKDYESKGAGHLLSFTNYLLDEDRNRERGDRTDYSQNALSAIENSGVQLMTIHSAKGLEFKHVILIKVCSGFRPVEKLHYFINEKETGKWTLSVKLEEEDKRIKSSFHKKIREEQKKSELEEFDRLLYVALTRAKETLTLIGSKKPGKNSWLKRYPFFSQLKKEETTHQTDYYTYTCRII